MILTNLEKVIFKVLGRDRTLNILQSLQSNLNLPMHHKFPSPSIEYELRRTVRNSPQWLKAMAKPTPHRVFILNPRGNWYIGLNQGILAGRLQMAGLKPHFFLCQDLPVCNNRSVVSPGNNQTCDNCLKLSRCMVDIFGFSYDTLNDLINDDVHVEARDLTKNLAIDDIDKFKYRDMPFGEYIRVSASSYFFRGSPEHTPQALEILRGFLYGLIVLYHAYNRLFRNISKDDILLILNGRFFWYRLAYEMAKQRGLHIVTYADFGSIGGSGKRWMFDNEQPIAYLDLSKSWTEWRDIPLTLAENRYLEKEFINAAPKDPRYYPEVDEDWTSISSVIELEKHKSFDTIYTNLTWDSSAIDRDVAFRDMIDWILQTVESYQEKDNILLIRVHPAEDIMKLGYPSRQRVMDEIVQHFPTLSDNIRIIQPTSPISSYTLLRHSRLNIIYTSTLGLEGALHGLPMIVVGKAPFRNKGFTIDIDSHEQYWKFLSGEIVPEPLTKAQIELARRYAFLYLYRTRIPLEFYDAKKFGVKSLSFSSLDELLPGQNPYLDWLVDTLVHGGTFALPQTLTNRFMEVEK